MSSLRSHFRNHLQQNGSAKQPSRVPTKSSGADSGKPSKAAQQVSKLAKRASKSMASEPAVTKSQAKAIPSPTPPPPTQQLSSSAQQSTTKSKRASVATSSAPKSRHSWLPAPQTIRTPSLVSGSSASTFDSPRSNGLRRKPSGAIDRYAAQRRVESIEGDNDREVMHHRDAFEDTVLGISIPQVSSFDPRDPRMEYPPESNAKPQLFTDNGFSLNATPPIPAPTATPSTRYTDSPFSHVPTPSSASSYSPGMVVTSNVATRHRQPSPTRSRPPVTNSDTAREDSSRLGLPPLRESSASSGSTVRPASGRVSLPRTDSLRRSSKAIPTADTSGNTRSPSKHKLTKDKPVSTSRRNVGQVPPELAHLNVDPPSRPALQKSLPPVRPSREGTPDLMGMNNSSHIIQSDLPRLYTTYHKRTPSQETPVSAPSPSFKTRFGFSPKGSFRGESPRIDSAISPAPTTKKFNRGPTPDITSGDDTSRRRQQSPSVAVSPSTKTSRFGFFSRKSRPDVSNPTEKPKRKPTKGPAAGTGHEGYGRFGFRGRSGSTTSSSGFRSSSTDSTASSANKRRPSQRNSVTSKEGPELDDFLKERLNPVILRGSGSTVSNTPSGPDIVFNELHPVSSQSSSSLDSYTQRELMPAALRISPQKRPALSKRWPPDSSNDDLGLRQPSLATRRSLTRMSRSNSRSPIRVPPPINTDLPRQQQNLDSYDAETSAWPQTDSTLPPRDDDLRAHKNLWLYSPQEAPKPKRKMNFLQHAMASPRSKGKGRATEAQDQRGSMSYAPNSRSIPHYSMLDTSEPVDLDEIGRIARENEDLTGESAAEDDRAPKMVPYENRHLSLLPSPPSLDSNRELKGSSKPTPPRIQIARQDSSESPELLKAQPLLARQSAQLVQIQRSPSTAQSYVSAFSQDRNHDFSRDEIPVEPGTAISTTPELNPISSPKQTRLSPVGRIPKVVSKRDRDRKLPDTSFSRPFARTQPRPSVKPPGSVYSQIREMASPIEPGSQPVSTSSTRSDGNSGDLKSSNVSTNHTSMEIHAQDEFFVFPRKDSDRSNYSTSSGNPSWMNDPFLLSPQQEDLWDEYNDFIDEVIPSKAKTLTKDSSLDGPFQYTKTQSESYRTPATIPSFVGPAPTADLPLPPGMAPVQTVLSVPQQISRFLQPSMSPLNPDTLSSFISGYGNRSTSTLFTSGRNSMPTSHRSSVPHAVRSSLPSVRESVASSHRSRSSRHSSSASFPDPTVRHSQASLAPSTRFSYDTQLLGITEVDNKSTPTASLRRGALMTSKWLSFGQVLFSPAHNEMQFTEEPRILVVDGLSRDWSYYVALSYPSAQVYNLGLPTADLDMPQWQDAEQSPPANHRQIRLSAVSAAFPFPKGFFTTVVFRFPTATTEQAYQACISECKRVLRPGGYLEVAVLDLDLMNMSAKTRKAVRDLKTRMQNRDREICLSNLSDVLVRLIGRRGFDEVQRCIVGVPAAGRIPRSRDTSSISSDSSGRPIWHREDHNGSTGNRDEVFSFADLIHDAPNNQLGPGKRNDESITKMVAKVGRWWYSACYERSLLPGDRSIWADRALLRDCEKQGTSFRLLICHAQKPAQTRRRTVSV